MLFKRETVGGGGMTWQLRAPAGLPEDLDSSPNTQTAAHNHL